MGEPTSIFDFLFGQLLGAVSDARVQLIERGWFGHEARIQQQWKDLGYGREDTPSRIIGPEHFDWPPGSPGHDRYGSFEELWAPRGPGEAPGRGEPGGMEIDR